MYWNDAKARALPILRDAYQQEIERIAEELAPRFKSGELGGFEEWSGVEQPLARLEREMGRRLAAEEPDQHLLKAVASVVRGVEEYCAEEAAALDVLRVALARGWYRPGPETYPSAADLAAAEVQP